MFSTFVVLPGSRKPAPPGTPIAGLSPLDTINVTIKLRAGQQMPDLTDPEIHRRFKPLSREDFATQYGSRQEELDLVSQFATSVGFTVLKVEARKRSVEVSGTIAEMEKAFRVTLSNYQDASGLTFRGRNGDIYIPKELEGIVIGVFGLDNRPIATPKIRLRTATAAPAAAAPPGTAAAPPAAAAAAPPPKPTPKASSAEYYPTDLAKLYQFPSATGAGECIAIIELGGGYQTSDINAYYKSLNLQAPNLVAISVDGGQNDPGATVSDADGEVTLDIEVAGTIAPAATIAVYFGGNNSKSFQDAVSTAIHDTDNKPSVLSISWGGPEDTGYGSYYTSFDQELQAAATMGISVCVAAGDSGSSDGVNDGKYHVDYPASSAYSLACGGTTLEANVEGNTITSEVVWNEPSGGAGGGGVSDIFPLPTYQANAKVPVSPNTNKPGRGVPDIAADADPVTGYNILLGGQNQPIGGTSAVAPLVAGLLCRLNQLLGKSVGYINPTIYASPNACRDITQGNNDTVNGTGNDFAAGPGWDACTGYGVPIGSAWLQMLTT
jgi:kumamolisin